jgi:hypothetical protein
MSNSKIIRMINLDSQKFNFTIIENNIQSSVELLFLGSSQAAIPLCTKCNTNTCDHIDFAIHYWKALKDVKRDSYRSGISETTKSTESEH